MMRRTASEVIRELQIRVARLERRASSRKPGVEKISGIVGNDGEQSGFRGWRWSVKTNQGDVISLYYEYGDHVEIQNPPSYMIRYTGKPDDSGIAFIEIDDLTHFFR